MPLQTLATLANEHVDDAEEEEEQSDISDEEDLREGNKSCLTNTRGYKLKMIKETCLKGTGGPSPPQPSPHKPFASITSSLLLSWGLSSGGGQ